MPSPATRRVGPREIGTSLAGIAAAWAAGVAQPLLDLYGKNATLFSAAKLDATRTVEFALLVALGGPAIWLVIALALARFRGLFRVWRAVPIGTGAAAALLIVARQHDVSARLSAPVGLAIVGAIALLYDRKRPVRAVASLMGLLLPLAVALFLLSSSVAHITWSPPGADVAIPAAKILHKPTIVWLVLDETNLGMLLNDAGQIDAERYPNLSALAATSTWYRNATGIDSFTPRAVPGMLASRDGSGIAWPTPADYPRNVFALLAGSYRIDAFEPVTDLCVARTCLANSMTGARRLKSFLEDTAVVYGRMVLPSTFASQLPSISDAWGGFTSTSAAPATQGAAAAAKEDSLAKFARFEHGPLQQVGVARQFIRRIDGAERPTLHFLHLLLPHRPWQILPDLTTYSDAIAGAEPQYTEPADLWRAQDEAARFALQAGGMDAVIGEIVQRLRDQGLWSSTTMILTADHGINLAPGSFARLPAQNGTLDELYRVPMIIHTPGQDVGTVSDVPSSTADLLPTLLGVLGAPPLSHAAGLDLTGTVPLARARTVWAGGNGRSFESGTGTIASRVATYSRWFPGVTGGWRRVFSRGAYHALLGQPLPTGASDAPGYRITLALPTSTASGPAASTALVVADLARPPGSTLVDGSIVVVSGGAVVGFLGGTGPDRARTVRIEGVVDWRAAGRPADLAFYLVTGPTASPTLRRIPR